MLTYFAKYVNLNGKVSQHTFFDTLGCFLERSNKNYCFVGNHPNFSSLSVRKERTQFNPQNSYSVFPFLSLSINTSELNNRKGKVNQLTWSS